MLQNYNPANVNLIVNINGKLVHRDQAGVSPFDSSVQNGDAVWEGLRLYKGRMFKLREHLDRLRKSAALLQYRGYSSADELITEVTRTLEANATHLFLVKAGVVETSTTKACPEEITRMTILSLCREHVIPSVVRDISEAEIYQADEVFCNGTMGEIAAVTRIDKTVFGGGQPGPLTTRLSNLYAHITMQD
jgi:branched-subunit amino acid aminotransferase/4-amino-4-deoxychorismate lyase